MLQKMCLKNFCIKFKKKMKWHLVFSQRFNLKHEWISFCKKVWKKPGLSRLNPSLIWAQLLPPAEPCAPDICGKDAICTVQDGNAICSCPEGLTGDPLVECSNYGSCGPPNPCGPNTECFEAYSSTEPTCECLPGMVTMTFLYVFSLKPRCT